MTFEAYLPVADQQGRRFAAALFREAFRQWSDQFGFVDTGSVYQFEASDEQDVIEQEFIRLQTDAPRISDNLHWLVNWKNAQAECFKCDVLVVGYRLA